MPETAQTLVIRYPNRRAVLASYRVDGPSLSLFVPTPTSMPLGERVRLEIHFGDCADAFDLAGQVTWRRAEARGMRLEAGLGISFAGGEKYQAARMLAFCAGRPLDIGTAGDPRVPAHIKCTVSVGKAKLVGQVRDISNTGAFVTTRKLGRITPGTQLTLTLDPGWFGWGGKPLSARVIWAGENKGMTGFGARFVGHPGDVRPVIKKYVGRTG